MVKTVFENERFVAVDKASGMLSIPGRTGKADARPCLLTFLEKQFGIKIFPVHRLDFEVSGVMLFAKDARAHRSANGWFESRAVHKTYEAWTEGPAPAATGPQLWESLLLRGKKRTFESPHGKPSSTRARWLAERQCQGVPAQSWLLEPLTGRSHQLRVELAKRGNPVLGDALYGSKREFRPGQPGAIALRAVKIDFSACPGALECGLPTVLEVEGLRDV